MKKIKKVYVYLVDKKVKDCLYIYDKGIERVKKRKCKNITLPKIIKEINEQNPGEVQNLADLVKNDVLYLFKTEEAYKSHIYKEIALENYEDDEALAFSVGITNITLNLINYIKSFSADSRFIGFNDLRCLINAILLIKTSTLISSAIWDSKKLNKTYSKSKYVALYLLCLSTTLGTAFDASVGFDIIPNYIEAYSHDLDDLIDENLSLEEQKEAKEQIIFDRVQSLDHLTDEEKEYMMLLEEYIKDNPYIDLDDVYKKLTTVNVTECSHADEKLYFCIKGEETLACNNRMLNNIIYFGRDFSEFKTEAFVHEYYHSIGGFGFANRYRHLNEGFTEYLTYETLTDEEYIGTYGKERLCVRYVMALIGKDKILEAYSKKDASILDEALEEVFGSMKRVHRFENLINFYCENKIGINEFLGFLYDNVPSEYIEKIQNESIMDITIREYDFMHTKKLK